MKASKKFFKTTSLVLGVVLLGLLMGPSVVYSQTSGGFYPLYGDSGYVVRVINPPTGTTNSWGIHGNVNYYALRAESWFGTDFVGTLKQLYAPFDGTASVGYDPNGGYWVAINGSGEWTGWFLRVIHVADLGRVSGVVQTGDRIAKESSTGTDGSHAHVILLWCEDPEAPRSTCRDVPFLAMLDRQYWPYDTYPSGTYVDSDVPGDQELLVPEGAVAPDWNNWPGDGQGSTNYSGSIVPTTGWQLVETLKKAGVEGSAPEIAEMDWLFVLVGFLTSHWKDVVIVLLVLALLSSTARAKKWQKVSNQLLKVLGKGEYTGFVPSGEVGRLAVVLYVLYLIVGAGLLFYALMNSGWAWSEVFVNLGIDCLAVTVIGFVSLGLWKFQVKEKGFLVHPVLADFIKVVLLTILIANVGGYLYGLVLVYQDEYGEALTEVASQQSLRQIAVKAVGEAAEKAVELAGDVVEAKTREIAPDWLEKLLFEESEGSDSSTGSDAEGVNQEAADIIAANAALEKGCPPDLIYGLWVTETNDVRCTDPGADCVSDAGAKGPLQFMDDTWPHYSEPGWDRNDLGDSTRAACRLVKAIGLFTSDDVHTFQKKFTSSGTKRPCWNLGEPGPQVDGWDQAIEVWQIMRSRPVTKNH